MSEQNQSLSLNEYQRLAMRSANGMLTNANLANRLAYCGLAVAGEAGEFADLVKKVLFHGKNLDEVIQHKLLLEAGDILWGLAFVADTMGTTLEKIAALNVAKLQDRYPDGFTPERANNRPPDPTPKKRPATKEKETGTDEGAPLGEPQGAMGEPGTPPEQPSQPTTPVLSQMVPKPPTFGAIGTCTRCKVTVTGVETAEPCTAGTDHDWEWSDPSSSPAAQPESPSA